MIRLLGIVLFVHAGLSAAQWGLAAWWLDETHDLLWCGNAIGDPYIGLVNGVTPLTSVCAIDLMRRCIKQHRCSGFAILALLTFAATLAGLAFEGRFLQREGGIDLGRVWWLP